MSLRDKILNSELLTEELFIPEWGETVIIREFSGVERSEFEAAYRKQKDAPDEVMLLATAVCMCVVDKNGDKVFTKEDIPTLNDKSSKALHRVFTAVMDFNTLTDEQADDAEKK